MADQIKIDDLRAIALRRVGELLVSPEHLEKIDLIKRDISSRQQGADSRMKSCMEVHLNKVTNGLNKLHQSNDLVGKTDVLLNDVGKLAEECEAALPEYRLLRSCYYAERNVRNTVKEVEKLTTITREVDSLTSKLEDPRNILEIHRQLVTLSSRPKLPDEDSDGNKYSEEVRAVLERDLASIQRLEERLAQVVCNILKNALVVASETNGRSLLVLSARIMFREFMRSKKTGDKMMISLYREALFEQCPQFQFQNELANRRDAVSVLEVIKGSIDVMVQFSDEVAPCFPQIFQVLRRFVDKYHEYMNEAIKKLHPSYAPSKDEERSMTQEEKSQVANMDSLMDISDACSEYHSRIMKDVGLYEPDPPLSETTRVVLDAYMGVQGVNLSKFLLQILQSEKNAPVEQDDNGRPYTLLPNVLFSMAMQPLEKVHRMEVEKKPSVLFQLARKVVVVLEGFADPMLGIIRSWEKMPVGNDDDMSRDMRFFAVINNGQACLVHTIRLKGFLREVLLPEQFEQLNFTKIMQGFLRMEKEACRILANSLASDLVEIYDRLFTEDWVFSRDEVARGAAQYLAESTTAALPIMPPQAFNMLWTSVLGAAVEGYFDALFKCGHLKLDDDRSVSRIRRDANDFKTEFDAVNVSVHRSLAFNDEEERNALITMTEKGILRHCGSLMTLYKLVAFKNPEDVPELFKPVLDLRPSTDYPELLILLKAKGSASHVTNHKKIVDECKKFVAEKKAMLEAAVENERKQRQAALQQQQQMKQDAERLEKTKNDVKK